MLVLKNAGKVMAEAGKPLVNNEINALRVENTDVFSFGVVTTGPIRVYWSDGNFTDVGVKQTKFSITKNFTSVRNMDIVITNPENVICLYFETNVTKIKTSVSWLLQFTNLTFLQLTNASFYGELGLVVEKLRFLKKLVFQYNSNFGPTLNVSVCKKFWSERCEHLLIDIPTGVLLLNGDTSDIQLNNEVNYIFYRNKNNTNSDFSGIIKNTYTKLTFIMVDVDGQNTINGMLLFDDFIVPETLDSIGTIRGGFVAAALGSMTTFNFKNIKNISFQLPLATVDLTNNQSFNLYASTCSSFSVYAVSMIKIDLSAFNKDGKYDYLVLSSNNNLSYGDITNLATKIKYRLYIVGKGDNAINGSILPSCSMYQLFIDNVATAIDSETIKSLAGSAPYLYNNIQLSRLQNCTGDISGCVFNGYYEPGYGIRISQIPNLYADITTFAYSNYFKSSYSSIQFYLNPNFTGNLGDLELWYNKQTVRLNNCAYTNIPGFVRKVFANRNTCLKAAGGMTNIQVQGNVDNNLLTGIEQQPPLGSYTGNINDLTEAQIDNLAAGKDYTGSGTSTPWTDKELIWVMTKLKNSSTDSSLRYRCTFSY